MEYSKHNFLNILGYMWALPVTLLGLFYVSAFYLMGWYTWAGREDEALVWEVDHNKSPGWLQNYWKKWGGHAIGNVVVLNPLASNDITLKHELRHVHQVMRLGVFQPIVYGLNIIAMKIGCPGTSSYHYNPFEVDARKYAGQKIEIKKF